MEKYVARVERDIGAGALHVLLLGLISRLGPIHGYALIRAMTETTHGALEFRAGTIYPILNELERMDIVRSARVRSENGPPRKTYELTETGREVLAATARRWRKVHTGVAATLGSMGGPR